MNDTPNDNPAQKSQTGDATSDESLPKLVRRKPWEMLLAGLVAGAMVGGAAGSMTSGAMGFVVGIIDQYPDGDGTAGAELPMQGLCIGLVLGGICGVAIGAVIGARVGYYCGAAPKLRRKTSMGAAAVLSALAAGACGGTSGHFVWGGFFGVWPNVIDRATATLAGAAIAAASGMVAGAFLGASLYRMAVDLRTRETTGIEPPAEKGGRHGAASR